MTSENRIEKRRPRERREDFLHRAHDAEGRRLFGKRWDTANIGWYSELTSISSKVYGEPAAVLTTSLLGDGAVHDVTPWAFGRRAEWERRWRRDVKASSGGKR